MGKISKEQAERINFGSHMIGHFYAELLDEILKKEIIPVLRYELDSISKLDMDTKDKIINKLYYSIVPFKIKEALNNTDNEKLKPILRELNLAFDEAEEPPLVDGLFRDMGIEGDAIDRIIADHPFVNPNRYYQYGYAGNIPPIISKKFLSNIPLKYLAIPAMCKDLSTIGQRKTWEKYKLIGVGHTWIMAISKSLGIKAKRGKKRKINKA